MEEPTSGDPMRQWGREKPHGMSLWWPLVARNKFLALTEPLLGPERASDLGHTLLGLEAVPGVADIFALILKGRCGTPGDVLDDAHKQAHEPLGRDHRDLIHSQNGRPASVFDYRVYLHP